MNILLILKIIASLTTAATGLPAIVLPAVDWVGAALLLLQCLPPQPSVRSGDYAADG